MIDAPSLNAPLSPRPNVVKHNRRQALIICLSTALLFCAGTLIYAIATTRGEDGNKMSSQNVRTQIDQGESKLILGEYEVCNWEKIELEEVQIYVDGVASENFQPNGDMLIEGVICDTNQEVVLALDSDGLHGSISSDDHTDLIVSALNAETSQIDSVPVRLPGYVETEKTKLVGEKFDQLMQSNRGKRREMQALEAGSVDIHLHLDIDSDMVTKFGSQYAAARYGVELIAVVNREAYVDLGFNLKVVSVNVRSSPLSQVADASAYLDELEKIPRPSNVNLLHSLTTRGIGGGVAYRGGLYSSSLYCYGVSGSLGGTFGRWDRIVVAHELGHNFGSPHTHDFSPPIDTCGTSCPANPSGGTIMSYCHLCSGGLNNVAMQWAPRVEDVILDAYASQNSFLAIRTECTSLNSIPDLGVAFYLRHSTSQSCLSMDSSVISQCSLESVWTFDGSQVRYANDDDLCWSAADCSSITLQDCNINDDSQSFQFVGGVIISSKCQTSLKYDGDNLRFSSAGQAVDQWCLPDADPSGSSCDDTPQVIGCGEVLTGDDFNCYGEKTFSFTASGGATTISTCGSDFDTMLQIQADSSVLASADDQGNCGYQAIIENVQLAANVQYKIVLVGYGGARGNWQIEVTCPQSLAPTPSSPTFHPTTSTPSFSPTSSIPTNVPTDFRSLSPTTSKPTKAPTTSEPTKAPTDFRSISPTMSSPTSSPVVNNDYEVFSTRRRRVCDNPGLLSGRWNTLGNQNSLEDCANACMNRAGCKFVAYRHDTGLGQCSAFSSCVLRDSRGEFTILEITEDTTEPETTALPSTMPTGSPTESRNSCRPCVASDAGCTHPGNANQAWCDSRCTEGVNDLWVCVASHCFCGDDSSNTDAPQEWSVFSSSSYTLCNGAERMGDWNNLGFQNSIESCARSCLDRSNCKFAAFRHDSGLGHCTGFTSCTIQENPNEFTVIEIQTQDSTPPQFFDMYGTKGGSPSGTTCHIDSRLTTFYRLDINECETRCASRNDCRFLFSNTNGACVLHSNCDQTRSPYYGGWTRQRAD